MRIRFARRCIRTSTNKEKLQHTAILPAWKQFCACTGATLHRRDALWAAALQTAIARRSGDSGAVQKHWYTAMEVLAEYSVDLFTLLPLGELWVAAARMRLVDRMQHTLTEAFTLLDSLGNPACYCLFPTDRPLTHTELVGCVCSV